MAVKAPKDGVLKHEVMLTSLAAEDSVMTIWTYRAEDPVPDARRSYEQGAIATWLSGSWRGVTSTRWRADRIKSWDFGTSPPTKLATRFLVPPLVGTNGGQNTPNGVAAVIALRTQPLNSTVRNNNNGRLYHPGVTTVTNDSVTNPTTAALATVYTALLNALKPAASPNSGQLSVVSFFDAGAPRVDPEVFAVDHILVRSQIGYLRRRAPKVGPYARGA